MGGSQSKRKPVRESFFIHHSNHKKTINIMETSRNAYPSSLTSEATVSVLLALVVGGVVLVIVEAFKHGPCWWNWYRSRYHASFWRGEGGYSFQSGLTQNQAKVLSKERSDMVINRKVSERICLLSLVENILQFWFLSGKKF